MKWEPSSFMYKSCLFILGYSIPLVLIMKDWVQSCASLSAYIHWLYSKNWDRSEKWHMKHKKIPTCFPVSFASQLYLPVYPHQAIFELHVVLVTSQDVSKQMAARFMEQWHILYFINVRIWSYIMCQSNKMFYRLYLHIVFLWLNNEKCNVHL